MSVNADHAVLAAADTGGWVDLCPDSVLDIGQGANWGQKRTVSAEVLTDLVTVAGSGGGRLWPIKVRGARVVGALDLEAATLARSLHLTGCYFDEPVNLEDVVAISISLSGSHVPSINAKRLSDPVFQPIAFTIDTLLPVVDLGQQGAWHPLGIAQVWAWVLTSAGWILTTAVLAGLNNALKRV